MADSNNRVGTPSKGPSRTGSLYWTKSGWRARVRVEVDGEIVQRSFDLETIDKQAARVKMRRLVKLNAPIEVVQSEAAQLETFEEAAMRIVDESGIGTKQRRLERMRLHVFGAFGSKRVNEVTAGDVRDLLAEQAVGGASKQSCVHLRNDVSSALSELWRADLLPENVCKKVRIPKTARIDKRERAVLREAELIAYLSFQHPEEDKQRAILERQCMACCSWFFGGLRWGDIRALRWEAFETEGGRFSHGWAPRKKTARPQALEVPEVLKPILRDYWERAGRPVAGIIFPVRRGKRVGEERKAGSIARALRRDLARAFGLEVPETSTYARSNGREDVRTVWSPAPGRAMTARERELLAETEFTRPTDFHSFRRAFKQGLADADVDVQRAMRLSGATDMAAHSRYLHNTSKPAQIPAAALPQLSIDHA